MNFLKIIFLIIVLALTACSNGSRQSNSLQKPLLSSIISTHDTTLFLFWTGWCGGSKERLKEYFHLDSFLKTNNHNNVAVVSVVVDDNVSDTTMKGQNKAGMLSYRISNAGSNAFINRIKLKKFLKSNFEKHDFKKLNGFFYSILVELLVTKKFEVYEENKNHRILKYRYGLQGIKVEIQEKE